MQFFVLLIYVIFFKFISANCTRTRSSAVRAQAGVPRQPIFAPCSAPGAAGPALLHLREQLHVGAHGTGQFLCYMNLGSYPFICMAHSLD